jgi:hypothetical protein
MLTVCIAISETMISAARTINEYLHAPTPLNASIMFTFADSTVNLPAHKGDIFNRKPKKAHQISPSLLVY